jgi:HSP20 family protein
MAMVEVTLKSDPLRPGWFIAEDAHTLSQGVNRGRSYTRAHAWRPPTDVFETDEAVVVRVEIAGMQEDGFSILLAERNLTIRGLRTEAPERRAYHQMEIFFGEFLSEVEIPCPILAEQAVADYTDGFLRLVLPKAQPQRIRVNEL